MLKIEVIKFEAQDVITASVAAPKCTCKATDDHYLDGQYIYDHRDCPIKNKTIEGHNCIPTIN